jgi:hypothetical protein
MIENSSPGWTAKLTSVSARTPPKRSEIRSAASSGAEVALIRGSFPVAAEDGQPMTRYATRPQIDKNIPARELVSFPLRRSVLSGIRACGLTRPFLFFNCGRWRPRLFDHAPVSRLESTRSVSIEASWELAHASDPACATPAKTL